MRTMSGERECTDMQGRLISPGYHYAPGPSACMFCICTDGAPKFCKPVLCSPPTDCKSFRVGLSCCEFICLDDEIKSPESGPNIDEITLRYVATPLMFILLIVFLTFFALRIRQARNRRAQLRNNRRLSIGFIGGSMGYMNGPCEDGPVGFPGPKYVPRGEAPPPYDEAIAQARVDALRMNPEHRNAIMAQSVGVDSGMRQEEPPRPSSVHVYSNIPRNAIVASAQQAANQAYMFNAPLLQPISQNGSVGRDMHNHPMMPPGPRALPSREQPYNLPDLVRLGVKSASSGAAITFPTGSLGTITNRGLINMINRSATNYNTPLGMHSASLHRTIPRLSSATDNLIFDSNPDPSFIRASRLQYLEMRRSFHRPSEHRPTLAENSSNSIPGNLDLTSSARDDPRDRPNPGSSGGPVQNLNLETGRSQFTLKQFNQNFVDDAEHRQKGTILHLMGLFNEMLPEQHRVQIPELPLTVDRPSCMCYTNPPGDDGDAGDADEYHSECENCKSANGSRWVLEDGWADEEEEGTQTLQRRVPPSVAPSPATATLPQPLTKQRSNPGLSSNWDNWFSVIQDSSSSEED